MAVEAPQQVADSTAPGVNRIDHFVIQVNDLWRSYEFYRDLLGAGVYQFAGLDNERLRHRGNQILFMTIAGHKGVGLSISNVAVPPVTRPFEHVTQGYEVSAAQLEQLERLLREKGVAYHGPETYESGFPLARSLWFQDPDGHTVEVCVRAAAQDAGLPEPAAASAAAGEVGPVSPARISHMRIEVTDVAAASRWFQEMLGFQPIAERAGEAYLQVRGGDQLLVLRPTDALSPRRDFVRGPHVDFEVPPPAYPPILERLEDIEGYWESAPHPYPSSREVDHNMTVYLFDPDGNRYQVSPAGSH
jgi:catechol 2,3-dioxygenase-like lactoylglutathione lyase family enzyme